MWLFLTVSWVGSQYVIVVFPDYCRFRNIRENLIFANIREFAASQIQSSR